MAAAPSVDAEAFQTIQNLVTNSQIFESRYRSALEHATKNMIPTLLIDVGRLDFYTDALYEFARFEVEKIVHNKPSRDELAHQIYSNLDLHDRLCASEGRKMLVEAALNSEFQISNSTRNARK